MDIIALNKITTYMILLEKFILGIGFIATNQEAIGMNIGTLQLVPPPKVDDGVVESGIFRHSSNPALLLIINGNDRNIHLGVLEPHALLHSVKLGIESADLDVPFIEQCIVNYIAKHGPLFGTVT